MSLEVDNIEMQNILIKLGQKYDADAVLLVTVKGADIAFNHIEKHHLPDVVVANALKHVLSNFDKETLIILN